MNSYHRQDEGSVLATELFFKSRDLQPSCGQAVIKEIPVPYIFPGQGAGRGTGWARMALQGRGGPREIPRALGGRADCGYDCHLADRGPTHFGLCLHLREEGDRDAAWFAGGYLLEPVPGPAQAVVCNKMCCERLCSDYSPSSTSCPGLVATSPPCPPQSRAVQLISVGESRYLDLIILSLVGICEYELKWRLLKDEV